ncbi:hypothetical protein GCM10027184_59160 [Saccharothrix stipae]
MVGLATTNLAAVPVLLKVAVRPVAAAAGADSAAVARRKATSAMAGRRIRVCLSIDREQSRTTAACGAGLALLNASERRSCGRR